MLLAGTIRCQGKGTAASPPKPWFKAFGPLAF
jgi:hypothetical protein